MTRSLFRQLQRKAFLARWSKMDWSKSNSELDALLPAILDKAFKGEL